MTKEFVCIVCPNGCNLVVEKDDNGNITVNGATCNRGVIFGTNEMTHPKRTICSTVKTVFKQAPVLPVRVSSDFDKDKIFDVMREINKVVVDKVVRRNDVIISNVLGLGVDVICTSDILTKIKE